MSERGTEVPGLGAAVAARREAKQLTQAELAAKVGAHVVTVCNIERGRRMPSVGALFRLADALGVSLDDLRAEAVKQNDAAVRRARKQNNAG